MDLQLRTDIQRVQLGDFALALGIEPVDTRPPTQGYTLTYTPGEDDEPDTYAFHIVASHERLGPLLAHAFQLLPPFISPIVEVDSYDAYRMVDVFIGREDAPVTRDEFMEAWNAFASVLLEDGAIGAGANSEDPFVEVFVDQWKGVSIHVTVDMRETVEQMLHRLGLHEVHETWPQSEPNRPFDATIRPVLAGESDEGPTLDDVILELRRCWHMELNVDPDRNLDESGRELGVTLWHASLIVQRADAGSEGEAFLSVWASARSLAELEWLIEERMREMPEWAVFECFSVTRVAFDDRPESLDHIALRRSTAEIHHIELHEPDEHSPSPQDSDG